jgi:hypothetical protein
MLHINGQLVIVVVVVVVVQPSTVDGVLILVTGISLHEELMLLIETHGELFQVVEQTMVKVTPLTFVQIEQFGVEVDI